MSSMSRLMMFRIALALVCGSPCTFSVLAAEEALFFETDVFPILRTHCFHCHGEEEELSGDLDLRLKRTMTAGGESGPAVVVGKPDESLLLQRLLDGDMPPEEVSTRPNAREIETIRRWIVDGARTRHQEPESLPPGSRFTEEDRTYWAFQPVRRPEVPAVTHRDQVRNPIDALVLARLEEKGFSLHEPADKATLARRAFFDLIGLLPSSEELEQFLQDESPDAYERLLDRLLASPHYGERWGRHWLDTSGYADSEGATDQDPLRPHAWRYRDYVVRSLNSNLPLDQFLTEQLAGDELVGPSTPETQEAVSRLEATGFLRTAPDGTSVSNSEQMRNDSVADTIHVVTSSILGLTVSCAQCHNHRYDPISQTDYYQLRSIFDPALNWKAWKTPKQRLVSLYTKDDRARAAEIEAEAKKIEADRVTKQSEYIKATLEKQLAKISEDIRDEVRKAQETPVKERTPEQKKLLQQHPSVNVTSGSLYLYDKKAADDLKQMLEQANKLRSEKPKEEFVRALTEPAADPPESHVFVRGDFQQLGKRVEPQSLAILGGTRFPTNDSSLPTTGRRLAYARWLTSGDHPLTARVLANRVWMHHFGEGLVATPADFGRLGSRPTHPLLLDWLASELVDLQWDLKRFHKTIMTSSAYRQSSARRPRLDEIDSQNRLLGRMSIRRMDAESLRDSLLKISGQLLSKQFGPPVPVMADRVGQWVIGKENLNAGRPGPVLPMHGEDLRRSIYVQVRRTRPLAVLDTFDAPAMDPNCDRRASSTAATQSLMLMNGPFVAKQSQTLAALLMPREDSDEARLHAAWLRIIGRPPEAEQMTEAMAFLADQAAHFAANPPVSDPKKAKQFKPHDAKREALAVLCQALLSSNAFLYID